MAFFGSGNSPSKPTMSYLDNAEDIIRRYMEPYTEPGKPFRDTLTSSYTDEINDPAGVLEKLMEGYEPSKRHDMMQKRLGQALSNTAAAGGARGGSQEAYEQSELTQGLLSEDMERYLNHVLGLHSEGLTGGKGMYDSAQNAARGISSDLSNIEGTKGSLSFQGEREKQQKQQELIRALMQGLGGILGTPVGGPVGGVAGSTIGGKLYDIFFGGK